MKRSPWYAPPSSSKTSSLPLFWISAKAIPCPFCKLPNPPDVATSWKFFRSEAISLVRPAQFLEDILVAVVLDIGKSDSVPLLQIAESARRRHILEVSALVVAEHALGQERLIKAAARAQVHIQPAVVVQIAKVGRHDGNHAVEPACLRHLAEGAVVVVVEQEGVRPLIWLAELEGAVVLVAAGSETAGEDVQPTVVVVVEKPRGKGKAHARQAGPLGHIGKVPFPGLRVLGIAWAIVAEQEGPAAHGRYI